MGDSFFDWQVSSLVDIQPFLRVANEIEPGNSRVAYLCRFHAYGMAYHLEQSSSGLGVRQFMDDLMRILEKDNDFAFKWRKEKSDPHEMQQFYLHYCDKFIRALQNGVDKTNRAQLAKLNQTVDVLFRVMRSISWSQKVELDQAILKMHNKIEEMRELYALDNILPVDLEITGQAIVQQVFINPGSSISRGEPHRDNVFIMGTPEEIADSERWDEFSTSDFNGLSKIFRDRQAVPSSLVELQPFLRVAKEVEPGNSRVAYLCRFYAYDMAHRLDPISSGLGVRQFKDDLLQSLQRDNDLALKWRKEKSDAQEMQLFYLHYCEKFIHTLQNGVDKTNHAQLAKLNQTVDVLFGVVRAINKPLNVEYDQAVLEMHNNIEEKRELYALDIIPPVDPENTGQAIAQQFFTYPGPSISRGEAHRDTVFIVGTPEEIADSERGDEFSTSDYNGLSKIFRDRMDIKCMPANVLDQMVHDISAEPISIPLALLQDITENFADERKIGQGGFGVVYKGVLPNGCVAVKKLLNSQTIDDVLFYRETNFLMSVKHQNIVRFLGYCANTENIAIKVDGSGKCGNYMYPELRERLLCFEYVSKGSLHNHLTDELRGLEWHRRYQIIKGICEGLQYLHKEKDIIHMDIKPDNILMDDLMMPKITDFGISKHLDGISQAITKGHHMSLGYCAPEYLHHGQVSFKSDIFSLGVIIIDLVTGRKEDPDIKNVLRRWRYRWNRSSKYPTLGYQQVTKCIEIAVRCVSHDPKERPYISDIIRELNEMESTDEHINSANEFSFSLISPYPWELLDIVPLELHFPFEAEKQIPCSLQLSNPRDDYIAFYIQTSSRQYCIEPNKGIVLPQSKSNVIITLQAQKEPRHLMYKDEFVVRCIVVNDDLRAENITKDMFDEKSSEMVDNVNLTVCDELPPPSSSVAA